MRTLQFGRYRTTKATVWRDKRARFEPRYHLTSEVTDQLRRIERADGQLRRFTMDARAARDLLEEALIMNAYGTASIEGNPLSLDEVDEVISLGPTPAALKRPEERELLNFASFMEKLGSWPELRTPDDVREVHKALMRGVLPDAGRFKTGINFIGRRPENVVTFVPAEPRRVLPELVEALRWLRGSPEHPVLKALVFFQEFESIHPFRDGNGRTGRALTTLLLHQAGYIGARYALADYHVNADRPAYYANLASADRDKDLTAWLGYMTRVECKTFEDAVRRFVFRDGLPRGLKGDAMRVAEWFGRRWRNGLRSPVAFGEVHAAFPVLSERSLRRAVTSLVEAEVLERSGAKKGTRYLLAARLAADRDPATTGPL